MVFYGEVVVNKKATKSDETWPPESQIWVLTKVCNKASTVTHLKTRIQTTSDGFTHD